MVTLPKKYVLYAFILLIITILGARFYYLQIFQQDVYQEKSSQNSVRVITELPVRGNIFDRNGILIADNRPSFSIYLIPGQTTSHTIKTVCQIFHLTEKKLRRRLRRAGRYQPVKIARAVDPKTLAFLQENALDLPGIHWQVEPARHYLHKKGFAHILGTLGEINERELSIFKDYELGDVVGKKGIERAMEPALRGEKGIQYVKVDAVGRIVEKLQNEHNRPSYPGKNLYLTIDARLQEYADTLMGNRRGAVVAIDVRNGEILTLLSKPDYDLDAFVGSIDPHIWQALLADTTHPLYARAYQSAYPPGSTYKIIAAIAALNEHIITPDWKAYCPGYFRIGRRIVRCWNAKGHGELNLVGAIQNSCNVYFYQLGLKIGIDIWNKYSLLFHFGEKTGVELTNENPGLVPSRAYYDKIYGKNGWTRGMLANLAIGQGELLVTPLQLAQFDMIIANRGTFYPPHLTRRLVDQITGAEFPTLVNQRKVEGIRPEVWDFIHEGMARVVREGTGRAAHIFGIPVSGKTGTAQNPHGKSHAWFMGFAPSDNPEIAIVVLVENGGSGGGVAAPIAGRFLRKYFYYQGKFDYQQEWKILQEIRRRQKEKARLDSLKQAEMESRFE